MSSEIASVSRGHHLTAVINPCVWDPHFHARGGPCSWAEWGVHGQTHRIALEMQTGCSQQWHVIYDIGTHLGLAVFQLKCSFHSDCERACSWALAAVSLQRGTEPVSARPGGSAWALHGNSDPVLCADSHRLGAGLLQLIRSPEL